MTSVVHSRRQSNIAHSAHPLMSITYGLWYPLSMGTHTTVYVSSTTIHFMLPASVWKISRLASVFFHHRMASLRSLVMRVLSIGIKLLTYLLNSGIPTSIRNYVSFII